MMHRLVYSVILAMAIGTIAGACSTNHQTMPPETATASPTLETPTARPSIAGPAWVQAAADRWVPGSPQWNALAHPDEPYRLGGSANGNANGITFTPNLARKWWDAWFANPMDRRFVSAGLQPGGLVLSADELKRVAELQSHTLPLAPTDYNPLGLPIIP